MARSSFAINQAIFSWPVVYINLIVKLHHIFQDFVSFSYFIKYRDTLISYLKKKMIYINPLFIYSHEHRNIIIHTDTHTLIYSYIASNLQVLILYIKIIDCNRSLSDYFFFYPSRKLNEYAICLV